MKLSTQSRYGVRAVFDIAYNSGGLTTQVKDIADRQRISPRYLEQILHKLKGAGIIHSKRGPKGGYSLAREASQIYLYDIIVVVEGPIELVFCVCGEDGKGIECDLRDECVTSRLWQDIGQKIAAVMKKITIQDLCDKAAAMGIKRSLDDRFMYYI